MSIKETVNSPLSIMRFYRAYNSTVYYCLGESSVKINSGEVWPHEHTHTIHFSGLVRYFSDRKSEKEILTALQNILFRPEV